MSKDAGEFEVQEERDDLPIFIHSELDDYPLTPYEFRVYARLARRAGGPKGSAFESIPNMAKACVMSQRQVHYALALLVKCHILTKKTRRGEPSIYTLQARAKWLAPERVASLRKSSRKAKTVKPATEEITKEKSEPLHTVQTTPAPGAAPTPAYGAGEPLHTVQTTPAPGADKGTTVKVLPKGTPRDSKESGPAHSRVSRSSDEIARFRARDELLDYYKQKSHVGKLSKEDRGKQSHNALCLLDEGFSVDDCKTEFDRQWQETWRGHVDWGTVRKTIGQRQARVPQKAPPLSGCPLCLNDPKRASLKLDPGQVFDPALKMIMPCVCVTMKGNPNGQLQGSQQQAASF